MASSNDLTDKMKELVVEEKKNGKNWNDLPFEMKEMVVKEMNLETRTRLKTCSKSDKYLVESIPMMFEDLCVGVCEDKRTKEMIVNVRFLKKLQDPDVHFKLMSKENSVRILNIKKGVEKEIHCSSNEDAKTMVRQMLFNTIFGGYLRFDFICAFINYPKFAENYEFKMHTKKIDITAAATEAVGWLKNVAPGIKSVWISTWDGKFENIDNIPAVTNAEELVVCNSNDIKDEQLLTFNCTKLHINAKSNITGKGMNQLIKKVIANDYPKGTNLKICGDPDVMLQTWEEIIDGLDIEMIIWDDYADENGEVKLGRRDGRIKISHDKYLGLYLNAVGFNPHHLHIYIY